MESIFDEISFSEYDVSRFILHTNEGKHYIVSKEKKGEIDRILQSDDIVLKKSVIKKIKKIKSTQKNNLMFFSDFQFKRVIIPAVIMRKLSHYFVFLFDKYLIAVLSFIILTISPYYFFINTPDYLIGSMTINFSWALVLLVFFFHEMGHAAACTKFKVKAGEIGFGVTSFIPVLYANVSEAWRLKRSERMIVNFGGVYFQNIFSLILLILAISSKSFEIFLISKTILIVSIFQFFPFYKSDGYWILTDLISEPNLFKNSRKTFYKKIINPHLKLNSRGYLIMFYYLLISCIITFFILRMGVVFFPFIINFPFFLLYLFENVINKQYQNINIDVNYLWAIFYVVFTIKMIFNNVKSFILSNGADKVKYNKTPKINNYE